MATRGGNPRITITGDADGVTRATRDAETHLTALQKTANHTGTALKAGLAVGAGAAVAGVGALAVGLKSSADAAKDAEVSMAKVRVMVENAGFSWDKHAKQIDKVIQAQSRLTGLDDEDLAESFGNMVRTTGNLNEAFKLNALAADLARSKGIGLSNAQSLIARVYNGSYTGVKRLGIAIEPVTKAQDALKESTKHATDAQVEAAKKADGLATRQKALGELQQKFGGQAKAYGDTTQGSLDKASVAWENLQETVGAKVTPIMAKAALGLVSLIDKTGQLAGPIRNVSGPVKQARDAITGWVTKNRADINSVIDTFKKFGAGIKDVFEKVALPIIKRTVTATIAILGDAVHIIRGVVRIVSGLLSGDWSKAWSGAKEVVGAAWKAIKTIVVTEIADVIDIIKGLGPKLLLLTAKGLKNIGTAIATGLGQGLGNLGHLILDKLKGAWDWVKGHLHLPSIHLPFGIGGDGPGRGGGGALPQGGAFGGSLKGARASLRPFAAIGARFGLGVSDGKRPAGTRTASGGISYHSTGEAIDMADGRGPDANKLNFFRYLKANYGAQLAELIYTPGGAGIKDGHPFRYTGAVADDHYDHVHVAFDSGRPGIGDGIGFGGAARLAESVGLPGVTFAQIAHGESGYDPKAIGHDPGGTTGYGLWQITTKYNDDIIAKYGGPRAMLDPHTNALAARDVWRRQGKSAWYGTKYVTGWDLHYKGGSSGGGSTKSAKVTHGSSVVHGTGAYDPTVLYPDPADPSDGQTALGAFLNARRPVKGARLGPAKGLTPGQIAAGATSTGSSSDDALQQNNELLQQSIAITTEMVANQGKLLALATQGDAILQATIAAVNGAIGGKVGLGFQAAGIPGSVARY